ncbi:MAG: hypothetical protein ABJN04_09375 [Hyphomicrobiales bacterium]
MANLLWTTKTKRRIPVFLSLFLGAALLSFSPLSQTPAHACQFIIPDANGNEARGPSFEMMSTGFLQGAIECGDEIHQLHVMTIDVDAKQAHLGVRDDPLFTQDVTGELKPISAVPVSSNTNVHIMGRVNQFPRIGVRRGFVRFATLCDADDALAPLDCSWRAARIKFRTTIIDTNADEEVDRSYHEMSIYDGKGRLHMVTFWTPHRPQLNTTANDWISALKAFGLDFAQAG